MGFSFKNIAAGLINPTALLGTGLVVGGDLMAMKEQEDAQKRQLAQDERINARNLELSREQMAKQEEFAKMGIRWKVDDARAAGLHPLAALGATGASYSPAMPMMVDSGVRASSPKAEFYSKMGQNLSRAALSVSTKEERLASALRLENMRLQNALLGAQINQINSPSNPPLPTGGTDAFDDAGAGPSAMVVDPARRVRSAPGRPAQEDGWRPDVSYSRTDTGLQPVIPQGISESMESEGILGTVPWMIRNRLAPNFGKGAKGPSRSMLPKGYDYWRWDRFAQEWQPAKKSKRSFGREVYEKFRYGQ